MSFCRCFFYFLLFSRRVRQTKQNRAASSDRGIKRKRVVYKVGKRVSVFCHLGVATRARRWFVIVSIYRSGDRYPLRRGNSLGRCAPILEGEILITIPLDAAVTSPWNHHPPGMSRRLNLRVSSVYHATCFEKTIFPPSCPHVSSFANICGAK